MDYDSRTMTDPKPTDDLREGLGLLFRAAKNLAKDITPEKTEKLISETGGEMLRVVTVVGEAVGSQLGKAAEAAEAAVERVVDKQRAERASEAPPAPTPEAKPDETETEKPAPPAEK